MNCDGGCCQEAGQDSCSSPTIVVDSGPEYQLENSVALPDHHCYRLYQNSISLRFPMKIIYLIHEKENAPVKNMANFTRSIVAFPVR